MQFIIQTNNLCKSYHAKKVVNNLSFKVHTGECFGLLGPNGAGKTTTIEMLEGLVKPSSGDIYLFEKPLDKSMFNRIGIQFQSTALPDHLTVHETLKLFTALYSKTMDFDQLVELCSLANLLDQPTQKLSGGQRQRILLALAMVNDPELLFLDEPTANLDPQARRQFWQAIEGIKASGTSILITTHYMDEAHQLCDNIAIMDNGHIIEYGHPQTLLNKHFSKTMIQLPKNTAPLASFPMPIIKNIDSIDIPSEHIDQTLKELLALNIPLQGMKIKQANLEDLFIKLTGHALRG